MKLTRKWPLNGLQTAGIAGFLGGLLGLTGIIAFTDLFNNASVKTVNDEFTIGEKIVLQTDEEQIALNTALSKALGSSAGDFIAAQIIGGIVAENAKKQREFQNSALMKIIREKTAPIRLKRSQQIQGQLIFFNKTTGSVIAGDQTRLDRNDYNENFGCLEGRSGGVLDANAYLINQETGSQFRAYFQTMADINFGTQPIYSCLDLVGASNPPAPASLQIPPPR